ncbi:hypothetical protein [Lentzea flaviverrucosa]|uniref:DUF4367 domain-containing protein n=1 Tax=Lentzea flaviverrucosa TaxID=200379 RepID=A0A1H9M7J2_9PSEU|nr:hypothetical protein [Lentzea flaviverrucosa]RDI31039.1 hypothetical protein DFR72_104374 [Lentzea flaviverrucosa]SER19710.1 hypothetical protein SAMN05216195_104253 [Lentzea flaviverrucosa]
MTDDRAEAALRDLGRQLHVPEPPDVTAQVLARINVPRRRNRWLKALVAAITASAIAFAVSPAVRAGVQQLLEFAGVEFRTEAPLSVVPPLPSNDVSLDEARKQMPFEIHLPGELGTPDRVTVHEGRFVSLHYGGLRLDQFDGAISSTVGKLVHQEGVEQIGDKIWIPYPHVFFYIDRDGAWHTEEPNGAGQTLLWQRGQVTMRLEGDLTKEKALEISAS